MYSHVVVGTNHVVDVGMGMVQRLIMQKALCIDHTLSMHSVLQLTKCQDGSC